MRQPHRGSHGLTPADPAQRSRGKGRVKARLRSEGAGKAKAAPDEMREVARPKRRCGRGRGGGSDPPRTFIRVDLSGERGVTRLAMRPEHRTKAAPDAMGGAAYQSEAGGTGRKNGAPTLVESASVRPTGGFMVASPEPLRKREGRA